MPVQELNDEMINLLASKLQRRYESNFAWVNSLSAYNNLPAVRGHWPLSNNWRDVAGAAWTSNIADVSGGLGIGSVRLQLLGVPTHYLEGLAASLDFNGANQYLESNIVDQRLDIIGNEVFVDANLTGITGGLWFRPDTIAGSRSLFNRWSTAGQQVFIFWKIGGANTLGLQIQTAAGFVNTASTSVVRNEVWQFAAFSYWTSGGNGFGNIYLSTATGILERTGFNAPGMTTIISANNMPLRVGALAAWFDYFDGRIANVFLCASRCNDVVINTLYQQTRALYGV